MSSNKKYFELQDLILVKTSIEKVLLHINERKENTVFTWVNRELKGLWDLKDNELSKDINDLKQLIQKEDYDEMRKKLLEIKSKIDEKISKLYREMINY